MACKALKCAVAVGLLAVLGSGLPADAAIINGSFEGGLTPWSIIGLGGTSGTVGNTAPTDGVSQLNLLTGRTGSGGVENTPASPQANVETFLNLDSGALDLPEIGNALEGSAVKQVIQANAGDVISFNWDFRAADCHPNPVFVCDPDFAFVSLIGSDNAFELVQSLARRRRDLPDVDAHQSFMVALPFTGTYTLGLGVMDAGSTNLGISQFLVDDVEQTPGAVPDGAVPEPHAFALLAAGLTGLAALRRRR